MRRTLLEQNQKYITYIKSTCPELLELDKIPFLDYSVKLDLVRLSVEASLQKVSKDSIFGDYTNQDLKDFNLLYGDFSSLYYCFYTSSRKIYKIAEEFGKELLKIEPKIDEKYLSNTLEPILIEFPDGVSFPVKDYPDMSYKSVVVMMREINKEARVTLDKIFDGALLEGEEVITSRQLLIALLPYNKDGTLDEYGLPKFYRIDFKEGSDIKEEISKYLDQFDGKNQELFSYIVNAMIYINSGNPDLREYKAPKKPENFKQRERQWVKQNKDKVMVDMTLLGFSYKKATIFGMEKTTVSGHFRWQPYDVGLSKVKLIWIESYEKMFKNFKDLSMTTEQDLH
jgi:hypothetical protein